MNHAPRCTLVSWTAVYSLSRELAHVVKADGFYPDIVIAVGRGGFAPARILCDFLHLTQLTSVKAEHYIGTTKQSEVVIRYPLSADIRGSKVLLVDDVNDSGDTLTALVQYVGGFEPSELRTAVLHEKSTTTFHVDYCAKRTRAWRWIIYPWAVIEDITAFVAKMHPPPSDVADTQRRLHEAYGVRVSRQTVADVYDFMDRAAHVGKG